MNNWESVRFENAPLEIIDGDRGVNYPKQSDFMASGYCLFLNAGNVTDTGFDFSDCSFISEAKDKKLRKGKLTRYDIVLTTRGTVGNLAFYDDRIPFENIRLNSGMVIIRPNKERIFPRYLYFSLKSSIFKEHVSAFVTGSAQPQLPIRDINRIEFPLPPLPEQRAIAGILGALDDKIEINSSPLRGRCFVSGLW
jgi:type I restriction enzyme S subunit